MGKHRDQEYLFGNVLGFLEKLNSEGKTVIVATHAPDLYSKATKRIAVKSAVKS